MDRRAPVPLILSIRRVSMSKCAREVEIELLGVARLLARREAVRIPVERPTTTGELLQRLAEALPALVGTVLTDHGDLVGGHALSRGGAELLRDVEAVVDPGERLLLLSLSAGG